MIDSLFDARATLTNPKNSINEEADARFFVNHYNIHLSPHWEKNEFEEWIAYSTDLKPGVSLTREISQKPLTNRNKTQSHTGNAIIREKELLIDASHRLYTESLLIKEAYPFAKLSHKAKSYLPHVVPTEFTPSKNLTEYVIECIRDGEETKIATSN